VACIEGETVNAAPIVHVGSMVGAVEHVLDAEVIELVEHVVGVVRQPTELLQQLPQSRAC
jgi:hypothetical protein